MEHAFNTEVAKKYDVNIAILLQHFKFWTLNHLANKKNIHDGLCWTYNSIEAFCETFPYWTRHQIEHLLKKAEVSGLALTGNYNKKKYDRTKWYALTPKAYQLFEDLQQDHFIERLYATLNTENLLESFTGLISENSEMDLGKFRNAFLKIPKPIPDTKPDTKPNNNILADSSNPAESDNFENNKKRKTHESNTTTFSAYSQKGQLEQVTAENSESAPSNAPTTPKNTKSDYRNNHTDCSHEEHREEKKKGSAKNLAHYRRDERFMRFYDIYPKKDKPQNAYKAFLKLNPDDALLESIIADVLAKTKEHDQWKERQYIPQPAKYLTSGDYESEIINTEKERALKKAKAKEEAEKRLAAQDAMTKKLAEQEKYQREKCMQYNQEGAAFRKIAKNIPKANGQPTGLKNLREAVGIKG